MVLTLKPMEAPEERCSSASSEHDVSEGNNNKLPANIRDALAKRMILIVLMSDRYLINDY